MVNYYGNEKGPIKLDILGKKIKELEDKFNKLEKESK